MCCAAHSENLVTALHLVVVAVVVATVTTFFFFKLVKSCCNVRHCNSTRRQKEEEEETADTAMGVQVTVRGRVMHCNVSSVEKVS